MDTHAVEVTDVETGTLVAWALGELGSEIKIMFDEIGYF